MNNKTMGFTLLSAVALTAASAVSATPVYGAFPPGGVPLAAPQEQGPNQVLREGIGKLIRFLQQGGAGDPVQLGVFLEREIAPYFDFAYMAQWVAGPRYRHMDADQRDKMGDALKSMFMGAMAQNLTSYRQGRVQFLRARGNPRTGEVILGVRAFQPGGFMRRLDFRMYESADGWKVFDVTADGQSALVYYRQHFARTAGRPMGRWR